MDQPDRIEGRFALWFAGIYALIVVVAKAAFVWFGSAGLYAAGAIAGATDMDAISITAARLFGGADDGAALLRVVVLAAVSNALVKTGIAWTTGSRAFARRVAVGLLGSAVAGVVTLVVL